MKILSCLSVLLIFFASHSSLAQEQECGHPGVSLGEVMAGLKAGLPTGVAVVPDETSPDGIVIATTGVVLRGFLNPDETIPGQLYKCDSDYGLISFTLACPMENSLGDTIRTPHEARECAGTGLGGKFVYTALEISGIRIDHLETAVKIGVLPDSLGNRKAAVRSVGAILEPYSLEPGDYIAHVDLGVDVDGDGIADRSFQFMGLFYVIAD